MQLTPISILIALFCVLWPGICLAQTDLKHSRLSQTPDLMQTEKAAALPYSGAPYCGPVAVSNSMLWLSKVGYPALADGADESPAKQGKLAAKLALYMNTTRSMGTTVDGMLNGLELYLKSRGVKPVSLSYQGWERCNPKYFKGNKKPDPASVEKALSEKTAVWLKVGWYRNIPGKSTYKRFAGHWLTAVDFNKGDNGDIFITVHDSAGRSGARKSQERVKLSKLRAGTIDTAWVPNFDANGMYKMSGQLRVKKGANLGILDGIIILKMQ